MDSQRAMFKYSVSSCRRTLHEATPRDHSPLVPRSQGPQVEQDQLLHPDFTGMVSKELSRAERSHPDLFCHQKIWGEKVSCERAMADLLK